VSKNTGDNNPANDANLQKLPDHGGSDEGGYNKQDEDTVAVAGRKVEEKKHGSATAVVQLSIMMMTMMTIRPTYKNCMSKKIQTGSYA